MLVLKMAKESCPQYYPFVLTLFRTGLREGEAVALMSQDLDLRSRYAVIQRNFIADSWKIRRRVEGVEKSTWLRISSRFLKITWR